MKNKHKKDKIATNNQTFEAKEKHKKIWSIPLPRTPPSFLSI